MAIQSPNYTQIPNEIIDEWASKLTGSEYKIIIKICRNTFGWQKKKDLISISQIIKSTGIGRTRIVESIKKLELLDLIETNKSPGFTTSFRVKVEHTPVQKLNGTSSESEWVTSSESEHTKEININKLNKEIFHLIDGWFEKEYPEYYRDAKQSSAIKRIETRFKTWDNIEPMLNKFKEMMASEKFWKDKPLTPSIFHSAIDHVISWRNNSNSFRINDSPQSRAARSEEIRRIAAGEI